VFFADARTALPRFRAACLSTVFIHFPDPWWKKRHQKRMVVSEPLLVELRRLIVAGGELFVQTDVEERALAYQGLIDSFDGFEPALASARIDDHTFGARSPRERRIMSDGLPIFRLLYRRCGQMADCDADQRA
jgi:tRNA (guanine-N7-)-methyltransferase